MSRRRKAQQNIPTAVMDEFSNPLFRLGYGSQSPLEATEYRTTRLTGNYALLNSLYGDNWVVQNVVGIIPDDMTKKWFTVTGSNTPEQAAALERIQRETGLRESVNEGMRWGRLFGGAAGLIWIDGHDGIPDRPLDLNTVYPGSFRGLPIYDRWCGITPADGLVLERGELVPEYYTIHQEDGTVLERVHHSRVIRFTGRKLPYYRRVTEQYWGASEVESLYREVVKYDNTTANMAALTFRANVDTMKVKNLEQLFSIASSEQQRRFWNTMQAQSVMKSNFGTQLVDAESDITNTQYSFSGLSDVNEAMCLSLSGAILLSIV